MQHDCTNDRKPTVDDLLVQRRGSASLHDEPNRMQTSSGPAPPTQRGADGVGYAPDSIEDGGDLLAAYNRLLAMCSGYADIAQDYEASATSGDANYGSGTPFSLYLVEFRANMRALLQEIDDRFVERKVRHWAAYHSDTLPPGEPEGRGKITQQEVADFYGYAQSTIRAHVNQIDEYLKAQVNQGALGSKGKQ